MCICCLLTTVDLSCKWPCSRVPETSVPLSFAGLATHTVLLPGSIAAMDATHTTATDVLLFLLFLLLFLLLLSAAAAPTTKGSVILKPRKVSINIHHCRAAKATPTSLAKISFVMLEPLCRAHDKEAARRESISQRWGGSAGCQDRKAVGSFFRLPTGTLKRKRRVTREMAIIACRCERGILQNGF